MEIDVIAAIGKETLYTTATLAMPILLIALLVGLVVSILQAVTQIQESTLVFISKMLAVFLGILFFMPYMYKKLLVFVDHIVQYMIGL
jgi:flagellar biosynthetic protein FliQ